MSPTRRVCVLAIACLGAGCGTALDLDPRPPGPSADASQGALDAGRAREDASRPFDAGVTRDDASAGGDAATVVRDAGTPPDASDVRPEAGASDAGPTLRDAASAGADAAVALDAGPGCRYDTDCPSTPPCSVGNCASGLCLAPIDVFVDLDGDGYSPALCGGGDCEDGNVDVNPGAGYSHSTYTSSLGVATYDWNCDGVETPYDATVAGACRWDAASAVCMGSGWVGDVPPCGASRDYQVCSPSGAGGVCVTGVTRVTQACR